MNSAIPLALLLALAAPPARAEADYEAALREMVPVLSRLVAADTSNPPGAEARAVAVVAPILRKAGIPFETTEFAPGRQNLVARLKGSGEEPPLLLLAHSDVPGADAQNWSSDPHVLVQKDGRLFGRGVYDMLGMAAVELETLLLINRSGTRLRRDVVWAFTGDEQTEGGGIRWLLRNRPGSIAAALALNEGAGVVLGEDGKPKLAELQMAEKTYQDFELETDGPGGHSAVPLEDNAIYRLSRALARLAEHRFPVRLSPLTRGYLAARAEVEPPALASAMLAVAAAPGEPPTKELRLLEANPTLSAALRTTCVATLLSAGTRVNTLPERARASVNCRLLPEERVADVREALVRVLADPRVRVRALESFPSGPPSPLKGPGPDAVRAAVHRVWPGLPIVPVMSRSATDSASLRAAGVPCYGINPIAVTEEDARRAHGSDERVGAADLRRGLEFFHKLVLELAARRDY